VTLPCDSGAVGYARIWAAWQLDVLLPWVPMQLLDDVQLVVSELVTNSLRAGCDVLSVDLLQADATVRLGVRDDARGMPTIQHPGATETHGRGLLIVAAVADDWGVLPAEAGKEVWAQFAVPERAARSDGDVPDLLGATPHAHHGVLDAVLGDQSSRTVTDSLIGELLDQVRRTMHVDTAAILLYDESRQFLVATAARGIEEEVRQGVRVRIGRGFAGRIAAERRPVILDEVTSRHVVNPLLVRRGIASMVGVPIFEGERVLGVMHVGSLTPRRFTPVDVGMLERGAARAAQVLVRHRTFVDRAGAAALLQSLTPRLPDLPGLDLAARYVPGSQYGVGGDWYDVFQLPPSDLVGVAIGDVMGHGLHAATVMGRVRSALRAYALEHGDPADVLTRLDRKIQHFEPGHLATVLYAVLDPRTGRLSASSAGHLPPMLVRGPGNAAPIRVPVAPPIGVKSGIVRRAQELTLQPGELICLYTDGMVERRTRDLDNELARLQSVLGAVTPLTAESACAQVMTEMLGDRQPEDDISLLTVKLLPG
jgi:putative methionine-R-sulfoxide reductase with GAF domain